MLKSLPNDSRPREKLLTRGSHTLTDAELLAIFLRTGTRGVNVIQLADQLLREFGSLRALFSAPVDEFCRHKGLGTAKYTQLQAVLEMSHRYLSETITRGDALISSQQTEKYLTHKLRHRTREAFYVLFLDTQHRLIAEEMMFEGTLDSASIYPREIVKHALEHNAKGIILAHNHPSGIAEPSESDRRVTRRIADAVALVDISLLDHFVIGDGQVVSFAERGWI
ncbi:RadC family protein [Vibrio hippocampi]|uniref:MPN domain-containing protein n=1 Tax=Vibrio hippocampi TaxID=654686 RepID=A0ABM8ZDZ4_9VIBR|nr:DNA repair protein RadC [Vibrio hippocampi]CAH0524419.1 hypothetical protein VHP8226_00246 [Vibrio hippocampi]